LCASNVLSTVGPGKVPADQGLASGRPGHTGPKASEGPVKAPRVTTCPLILHLYFTADILPYNFTDGELCENCKIV